MSLPQTGQTNSFATGDDGDLRRGVTWPSPRFTSSDGGATIVDHLTGLMWPSTPEPVADCAASFEAGVYATWSDALTYLDCIDARAYLGHGDWRLPNRWEMRSLFQNDGLDCDETQRSPWLLAQGFRLPRDGAGHLTGHLVSSFGTSTAMIRPTTQCHGEQPATQTWVVGLCGATFLNPASKTWGVWPVRNAAGVSATIQLPQTGLTTCYDTQCNPISCAGTGQDAETMSGVAWPSPRAVTNADGTVTDQLTELVWGPVAPEGEPLTLRSTWSEALAQLGELNAAHHLGHDDWRMPNVNELMTLAPGSSNDLGLNLQADCAWSSTRVTDAVADDHETAWILEPTVGSQLLYPVANASCVLLPVRGGP